MDQRVLSGARCEHELVCATKKQALKVKILLLRLVGHLRTVVSMQATAGASLADTDYEHTISCELLV